MRVTTQAAPPSSRLRAPAAPLPVSEPLPLTKRQTLFWIERQLTPGAPIHNTMLSVDLQGRLDTRRLEAAYRATVAHLDGLRIFVDESSPRLWIVDADAPDLEQVDLSGAPETFKAWKAEQSLRPFAFPGWLFRPSLVRLGPEHWVFCVVYHHIGSDAAALLRMVEVLAAFYEGREPAPGPSFRDYLQFEAAYRISPKYERDAKYWADKMGKGSPPLRFYGRAPAKKGVAFDREWYDGGAARKVLLEELLKQDAFQLLTPNLSRLAALSTVVFAFMHRVTDGRELVIATPLENRVGRFQNTPGLLMEETFLKVEVEAEETFLSLFKKVRKDLLQSLHHGQHCVSQRGLEFASLNLLAYRVDRFGDLACKVRFETAVTQGMATDETMASPNGVVGVQLHDIEDSDHLILGLDLHAATFPPALRGRILGHFVRVLDSFLEDPSRRIAEVSLMDDEERADVVASSRGPEPETPAPDLIDRFAEQCARHPDKIAIQAPDGQITYAALFARVNQLAHRLVALGIGPEKCVAVSVPRGIAEVTTLLAVLTAGGAYLPIDATQPLERLLLILEDASPALLVTRPGALSFVKSPNLPRMVLEADGADSTRNIGRPSVPIVGSELAYVLFTSGSTGRPKGVEVTRGCLANFLASMEREPGLGPDDRILAITTTMFDIAGLELFLPLWVGATVQIADHETAVDARHLRSVLERDPITLLQATPSTWRSLVDVGWSGDGRLRMLCGGEPLSRDLADKLLDRGGELWNMYGPTETTVWSTVARIGRGDDIVIGRPIDRTQVFVLDPGGHLAPRGVTGELCIGGSGVARGYRGRPDLTAQRFVTRDGGERIYRTGDLGRLLDSDAFQCLGRIDQQIKIRGHRIELGEIEAVLRVVDGVSDVVVVPGPTPSGDPRLIAYYTGKAERSAIFDRIRSALPQYLHPNVLVHLPALPLTPNGKVDRKALPEPPDAQSVERERVPPKTAVETELCRIWASALGVPAVGTTDDFFDLGGHSLLAVKVCDQIHRSFDIELPLAVFFEAPTVESLARRLAAYKSSPDGLARQWTTVVPFQVGGNLPPLFVVSGLGGNPMNLRHLARALGPDQPFYGLQHRGVDGRLPPHRKVQDMAREFLEDVREVQPRGPYYLAGHSAGGLPAFEMACLLEESGETVGLLVLLDTLSPTAPKWSSVERFEAHFDNLTQRGPRYIANRMVDGVTRRIAETRQKAASKLAAFAPFRFRHEALVEAGIAAEVAFRPRSYGGHVVLLQADSRLTAGKGIGHKPHESNGWRDYVRGRLEVTRIECSHMDIVSEQISPRVAVVVRTALSSADHEGKVRRQFSSRPPPSKPYP